MCKTEHEQTVSAVVGFIMEGHTRRDIIEWLSVERSSDDAKSDETYNEACEVLLNAHRTTAKYNMAFVIEGLKEMYRRLTEIGDYAAAAKVLVLIDKARKS